MPLDELKKQQLIEQELKQQLIEQQLKQQEFDKLKKQQNLDKNNNILSINNLFKNIFNNIHNINDLDNRIFDNPIFDNPIYYLNFISLNSNMNIDEIISLIKKNIITFKKVNRFFLYYDLNDDIYNNNLKLNLKLNLNKKVDNNIHKLNNIDNIKKIYKIIKSDYDNIKKISNDFFKTNIQIGGNLKYLKKYLKYKTLYLNLR